MRETLVSQLREGSPFDLLVIGGGATGCGIAVDAATRGLKVALIERNDFAEGTSSRSTKLVHGGVRYLEAAVRKLDKAQYKLVREALHERGALLKNAPHLTNRLPLVTPVKSWWQLPYLAIGLKLYDWLSGHMSIGHSKVISKKEALRLMPSLNPDTLKAAVVYYDGQFVDCRMVATLMMTARRAGAVLVNHVEATALHHDDSGRVCGATVHDRMSDETFEVRARAVVNATGPYADAVCRLDDPEAPSILKVSTGAHIILDGKYAPPGTGFLVPKTDDGRVLFVLPWQGHTLVGTTDDPSQVVDHPEATQKDVRYLLDYVRRYFNVDVSEADVRSSWCGIRPLVFDPKAKQTSQLARDHVIIEAKSGLITISGGKWTTYRRMSEETVDRVVATAGLSAQPCRTHDMKLIGGETYDPDGYRALMVAGVAEDVAHHLNRTYGDQAAALVPLITDGFADRLADGLPYIMAEVIHAIRQEQAVTAADVLLRRMTMALVDRPAASAAAPRVVEAMAGELGWSEERKASELTTVQDMLARAI